MQVAVHAHDHKAGDVHREVVQEYDPVHDADGIVLKQLILVGAAKAMRDVLEPILGSLKACAESHRLAQTAHVTHESCWETWA
jgi:hypothetical protein